MVFSFAGFHPKTNSLKQKSRRLLLPAAFLFKINSIAKQADRYKNNTQNKNKICLLSKNSSVSPFESQVNHIFFSKSRELMNFWIFLLTFFILRNIKIEFNICSPTVLLFGSY